MTANISPEKNGHKKKKKKNGTPLKGWNKNYQSKTLYLAKLSFKNGDEIKAFLDKQKHRIHCQ